MRYLLTLALVAFTCLLSVPAAAAENDSEAQPVGKLMLVLDSSGSMAEPTGGGTIRIDAAREALHAVIDQMPDGQPVGLRVFGATVDPAVAGGTTESCTDSQLLVDVDTSNRDELADAVDAYTPLGETPIGHALGEAATDLGDEGQRSIVLVSDGESNCDPDPCVVAQQLTADGIDVRIDVVGLNVDGAAREQLTCIADAGGGVYYDANDTESLIDGLIAAHTRSTRPFDLTGTPIRGTAEWQDAPDMEAPGQYLDTIPLNDGLHYRIPRTIPGSTIHVGVTFEGTAGSLGEQVLMALAPADDPQDNTCASGDVYGVGLGHSAPYHSDGFSSWKSDPDDPCNTSDALILGVGANSDKLAGNPIEIAVYEEPPLVDGASRDLPKTPADPSWKTLDVDTDQTDDLVPGTSLANAPVVTDGTYALDIAPGETQVFAVPLDWGQNIQAQLDATLTESSVDAAVAGSNLTVGVVGPLRTDDALSFFANEPDDWTTTAFPNLRTGDTFRTGAQSAEIAFLQRTDGATGQPGAAMPGLRYIRVVFESPAGTGTQPYTLTIATNGKAGKGTPEYDTSELPEPEADSPLVVSPVASLDPDTAAGPGQVPSDDAFPLLPVALGSAGLLALLAAGALVIVARRR